MEHLKKMNQYEEAASGKRDSPRRSQKLGALLRRRNDDSDDEHFESPHESNPVQPNQKSSPVGAQITEEDKEFFISRRSAMSALIAENFRSSRRGSPAPFKQEEDSSKRIEQQPKSMPLMQPSGDRNHSGLLQLQPDSTTTDDDQPQPSGDTVLQINAEGTRLPSGLLYPCFNEGGNPNSCLLNAAHFTFDTTILTPDLADAGGGNNLTERIFKKLMGQSKTHRSNSKSGSSPAEDESKSPNSTLDCPTSPASSERSSRGKSKNKSLRCRSEVANTVVAANPRPKSQLAQYLRSMTAMSEEHAVDDDDLEGPSEAAWLDPDSPYHPNRQEADRCPSTPRSSKKKPTLESWSSNSSSWNLSLVQNPLKTVSTIVRRRHQEHGATPGRAIKKGSRFGKDSVTHISLTGSYDGSSTRSRKGNGSDVSSGRSWWSEIGSGRKSSSMWACSGRLQTEAAAEPDLRESDMEPTNAEKNRAAQRQAERAKDVDEEAFPFNNPVASSFVFQEAEKSQVSSPDAAALRDTVDRITLHSSTVSATDSEGLPFSDAYHDPEDGSITDSETSHSLSLDREGPNVTINQTSQWDSARSFDYGGVVGLSSRGMSSRALSGLLEMGRSGRFSVDLNRGQKLDKAQHLPTPDVRLRIFASEKSSKRSILSPCLPFLQKSPHKTVPRIQHAPAAGSSRRIQAVNSFTARLGPVAENNTLAGQFHLQ